MNVRRVVRVGGTVVLVTGTGVVVLPASGQTEQDWVDALADACARLGDTAGAASADDLAAMYQDLVETAPKA